MSDRENILKGLECLTADKITCNKDCPYFHVVGCVKVAMSEARELLKEQQETIASLQGPICKLNAALEEQPEQKHGHWEIVQDYYDDEQWQCSACGCEWYLEAGNPEENNMLYCPECGAKMDEAVEQDDSV